MSSEYSEVSYYVKATECSVNGKLSNTVLLGDLQEAADTGAHDIGFDRFVISKFNACWIILRMKVHIIDMPKWRDSFSIRTWSTGCDKFFFDREYEVFNDKNEVVAMASSIWIMADIDTHRPIIPSKVEGIMQHKPQSDRLVFDGKCSRLKAPNKSEFDTVPVLSKYADYSELDWNNHVNNTRYVSWICDALFKSGYDPAKISDIEINYISEVKEGEKVDLFVKDNGNVVCVYGYRDEENGIFAAEIILCN